VYFTYDVRRIFVFSFLMPQVLCLPLFKHAVSSLCSSVMKASHPYRRGVLLNVCVPNAATTCGQFDEMTEGCLIDPLIYGKSNVFS
jgi:hypothetical protein